MRRALSPRLAEGNLASLTPVPRIPPVPQACCTSPPPLPPAFATCIDWFNARGVGRLPTEPRATGACHRSIGDTSTHATNPGLWRPFRRSRVEYTDTVILRQSTLLSTPASGSGNFAESDP